MQYDRLIYGKDSTERIVCLEVGEDKAVLFTESPEGQVQTITVPNRYWILAPNNLGDWRRLKGDLHYKFGKQFLSRSEFLKARMSLRRRSDCFSIFNPKEALMVKDGYTYFKGMKHHEVSVAAIDLETTGLTFDDDSDVLLIACTLRKCGKTTRKLFCYDEYPTRKEMIEAFCAYIREENPSIILGHNIFCYDLPYLAFVSERVGARLSLGRNGSDLWFDDYESKYRKDAAQFYNYKKAHVYGRELVDTMFLAIRYDVGRKYESYGLKSIIASEKRSIEGRQFYDASKIRLVYKDPVEWGKIKLYATHDGDDALALYDLMSPALFYLTQTIPKPYQLVLESAAGSQINAVMMRSYLQEGHSLPKDSPRVEYEGAISFGNPGIYHNVFKVDVASLYPNIILQYEVCDESKDPNRNFLKLVETFTARRLKHKKLAHTDKYYDDLQNAEKIFINSCYGFCGATGLLFNSPSKAAFITEKGRSILQESIRWVQSRHFDVVNADTDSVSFSRNDGSHFEPNERVELLKDLNSLFPERIKFEDDGYYPLVIVLAGKNYVLDDGRKRKLKGSAIKATTKEPALQEFIQKTISQIAETPVDHKDDLNLSLKKLYDLYAHEIMNITDIKRWATRKTITDKVLNAKRTNEQKVKDAIANAEYVQGDRAYFYFKEDGTLCLVENFDGTYNREKLYEKLYKTAEIFDSILDVKKLFPNYKLKRNKALLENLALF